MDTGNSAEKLIASIVEEAQSQAAAIEANAEETVAAVRRRLDEDRERLKEEFDLKARAAREETLARARTNAELAARKELLARKRALIDEAYTDAYEKLCAVDGEEREALLGRLLKRECEGYETVCPSEKDRAALEKLIASSGIPGLTLGETDGTLTDGFNLYGKNYFKCCSFAALMEEVRSATQSGVTEILFG